MLEGPSGNRKRNAQQSLKPKEEIEKKAKKTGKTVIKYSDYLQCYLTRNSSDKTSLASSRTSFKSLQELSIEAVVSNPEIIKQCPPELASFQILEAGTALLFAPKLDKKDWAEQLDILKKYNAKVCGIEFSRFVNVDVVDLSTIQADEVTRLIRRKPNELIVVYGICTRSMHLPISKGATVIGRDAVITVMDKSFRLHIPKAKIIADPQEMAHQPNSWQIAKSATEISTNARQFNAGYFPLVYLNQSSLVGVELDCQNVTQGIIGSKGNIHISNNEVINTRECGIFVHDCELAVISGNQLHTREENDKISVSSATCKKCEQTETQ